ncbi:MAG TPA: hypothetical protein VF576_07680, partial [Rubricoccaceae bacterium]
MSTLSERLDAYAVLPPDERAAVDREVAALGSTDADARLADARAFADLLDAAGPGHPVTADDVAAYVADLSLGLAPPDGDRVGAALEADPVLRAEASRAQARLDTLHAGVESPLAQFERLSGHRLSEVSAEPLARVHRDPGASRVPDRTRAADRTAAPRARVPIVRRLLVAATVVLVAYGGLAVASDQRQTERARVADLADLTSYAPPTMRGADTDPLPSRLDAALDDVAGARRSTLGLFPRYEATALDAAATELIAVAGVADGRSAVSQEA